jgi:Secretion system C-terminal sorting domain
MDRLSILILIAFLTFSVHAASAQPGVTEEIGLDPGFRYHYGQDNTFGISMDFNGEEIFFSWSGNAQWGDCETSGIRTLGSGEEVDRSVRSFISSWVEQHAISGFDGNGWKVFREFGSTYGSPTGLAMSNHDSENLAMVDEVVIVEPGTEILSGIAADYSDSIHVAVWIQETTENKILRLVRLAEDLTILSPGIIAVGNDVGLGLPVVQMRPDGGIVGWSRGDGGLLIKCLSSDGMPVGTTRMISSPPTGDLIRNVDIAPFGENWLIAWSYFSGICRYTIVDHTGLPLPAGVVQLPDYPACHGVSVAVGDELAVLFLRGNEMAAVRVDSDGDLIDQERIHLHSDVIYDEYSVYPEFRMYHDSVWTGEHFVVTWNNWWDRLITKQRHPIPPLPVYALWINEAGEIREGSPEKINRSFEPGSSTVTWHDGLFRTTLLPQNSDCLNSVSVNCHGEQQDDGVEYGCLPGEDKRGGYIWSRQWEHGTALLTHYSYHIDYPDFDAGQLMAYLIRPDGAFEAAACVGLVDNENLISDQVSSKDLAVGINDEVMIVHGGYRYATGTYYVAVDGDWIDSQGRVAKSPSIVWTGNDYLMVWAEFHGDRYQLYQATIPAGGPTGVVVGQPVLPSYDSIEHPFLVRGPDHILCVFDYIAAGAPPAGGGDICALRFDETGLLLDSSPILVSDTDVTLVCPKAVWDGENYLVAWCAPDMSYAISAGRISSDGIRLDGDGFSLNCSSYGGIGMGYMTLASNGYGVVAIGYRNNKLKIIYDAALAGSDTWPDSPGPGLFQIEPYPNPTRGKVHFNLTPTPGTGLWIEVTDLTGRMISSRRIDDSNGVNYIDLDQLPADHRRTESGIYWLRVRRGDQSESRRIVKIR